MESVFTWNPGNVLLFVAGDVTMVTRSMMLPVFTVVGRRLALGCGLCSACTRQSETARWHVPPTSPDKSCLGVVWKYMSMICVQFNAFDYGLLDGHAVVVCVSAPAQDEEVVQTGACSKWRTASPLVASIRPCETML